MVMPFLLKRRQVSIALQSESEAWGQTKLELTLRTDKDAQVIKFSHSRLLVLPKKTGDNYFSYANANWIVSF